MTLQHEQLQQAEFGTGQTGHEVHLQLPKNKHTFLQVLATKTFTMTEETEIQKQHKNNIKTWRILVVTALSMLVFPQAVNIRPTLNYHERNPNKMTRNNTLKATHFLTLFGRHPCTVRFHHVLYLRNLMFPILMRYANFRWHGNKKLIFKNKAFDEGDNFSKKTAFALLITIKISI